MNHMPHILLPGKRLYLIIGNREDGRRQGSPMLVRIPNILGRYLTTKEKTRYGKMWNVSIGSSIIHHFWRRYSS